MGLDTGGLRAGGLRNLTKLVKVLDNFEDGDITTFASEWDGWKGGTGDLTAQTTTVLEGQYTGKFEVSDTGKQVQTERSSKVQRDVILLARADGDTGGADDGNSWVWRFNKNVGNFIGGLDFGDSNGNVEWTGDNSEVLASWSVDTTYEIEFDFDWANDQVDIIINGTNEGTFGFANSETGLIEVEHRNNTFNNGTRATFIDNIRIPESA